MECWLFCEFLRVAAFVLTALCFAMAVPAGAQTIPPSSGANDPYTAEVLRALQQRANGQAVDQALQPNVQIQSPPVYPSQSPDLSVAPGMAMQGLQGPTYGAMSSLERLMSQRAGQRIRQFGYDVFGHGGQVVVRQSGALQDNYVLGDGDEIVLTLRGQENATYHTRVDRDGRVLFPGLPPVAASGRGFGVFRSDVEAAVGRAFAGTNALVSVGAVRQISVRVVGEIGAPGVYSLTGLSTMMDALNLAGGVKKTGSLRDIQVVRNGRTVHLDLYALLTSHAGGSDVTLTEGDRIIVPLQSRSVAVVGQVKRPAIYELPPRQNAARMQDLLSLAGGPEVRGAYRFSILRTRDDGRREMVQTNPEANVLVRDGDVLFVASTADVSLAKVELMGSTKLNGYYPLNTVGTLHGLLKTAEMFSPVAGKPLPYLLIAAVVRLDPQTMQRTVIPFSPVDIISGKGDLRLQSNDVVYILNVAEMRFIAGRAAAAQEASTRRVINEHPGNSLGEAASPNDQSLSTAAIGRLQTSPTNGMEGMPGGRTGAGSQTWQPFVQIPETPNSGGQQSSVGNAGGAGQDAFPYSATSNDARQAASDWQGTGPAQSEDALLNPGILALPERGSSEMLQNGYGESGQRDGRQDTSRSMVPNTSQGATQRQLRIFVGLDDDERHLLVSTLGYYYVTVVGEVNNPGSFLAMPQTTLDKIVQAAGGVTPKVDLNAFEITSAEVDNSSGTSRTIRKTYNLAVDQFSQVGLRPYDRVRFNQVFSDRDSGEASVFGEIKYPGGYEILRGEHLSSVLGRAGGFTDAAYPDGAIFLRRSVAEQERGVLKREADALESQLVGLMGSVSSKTQISDTEIQYVNQMVQRLREAGNQGGRVAVQIDPRVIAAHPELDVVLEPGDQLFIPRKPSSVIVAGEVMSPGGIQYRTDRSVSDYVALAGGVTEIADDDHIFVIQPDGSAVQAESGWSLPMDSTKLAPGSVIVVPRTLRHFTWDTFLENAIQMTSQLAITAASISVIHP